MDNLEILANKVFKEKLPSIEEIYNRYPSRNLKPEQRVTRVAPSPTGFVHIGTIYAGLIAERIAHTTNGIFIIRIEDTDTKREVKGSADALAKTFQKYGLTPDEGMISGDEFIGNYGSYKQSERKEIYHTFIKDLIKKGLAYSCFCTEEELENIVNQQKAQNCPKLGYYGMWAKYRNFPIEEAIKKIDAGEEYVIRIKSNGDSNKKIVVNDLIKGNVEFPESDQDIVIMKRDGLPTYHFAHIIDDFLMGTTIASRGDEWLPSVPLHLQLFKIMKWKAPRYAHIAPIMKIDETGSKRKLSKRKDPEANVEFYDKEGYPIQSVIEYLMNLANSNFEDWRKQNPTKDYKEFPFSINKLGVSGALFDFAKLASVSKEVIGRMSVDEIIKLSSEWAEKYDAELFKLMSDNKDYVRKILNIERDNPKKVRKDIVKWSDMKNEISYFFDLDTSLVKEKLSTLGTDLVNSVLSSFKKVYNENDDNQQWFDKVKVISEDLGYTSNMKEYKQNPNAYKGTVADIAKILRIAITGREQSPDLCSVMKVLGKDGVTKRLNLNLE